MTRTWVPGLVSGSGIQGGTWLNRSDKADVVPPQGLWPSLHRAVLELGVILMGLRFLRALSQSNKQSFPTACLTGKVKQVVFPTSTPIPCCPPTPRCACIPSYFIRISRQSLKTKSETIVKDGFLLCNTLEQSRKLWPAFMLVLGPCALFQALGLNLRFPACYLLLVHRPP